MLFSFIVIILLLLALTFVWPPDSPWSPWWRTNKKAARIACQLAKVSKKDVVYELGSGDGEFVLTAAKEFGAKKVVGIEIDYSRFFISILKKNLDRVSKAEFRRADFKKVKLTDATVVYFYLVPAVIKRILPKLKRELKPGTRIVSFRYEMPLKLIKEKDGLYLYNI
jgi:16S rRNA A1518/A1519 N6-dimethyltransferase RsmA/KsgA/DIM1 with predicted DNA glycosylase/AP lyase activity